MSIIGTTETINEECEKKIIKEVVALKKVKTFFQGKMTIKTVCVKPYLVYENKIYIPFAWALKNTNLKRREASEFKKISCKFIGKLNEKQKEIKAECLERLNNYGSLLLALHVGFGKTCVALYLACKIGLKTMIITHRNVLYDQWLESIQNFTNGKGVIITTKPKHFEADFLIVSPNTIKKLGRNHFSDIGCIIIDECHCIVSEKLSECLQYLSPRFLLACSATPTRPDGLDSLIDLYFGVGNKIVKELYHPSIVYKIETDIEYEVESNEWSTLMNLQCFHEERNELIIKIALKYSDRNFLILSKRTEQCEIIYKKLLEKKQLVSMMIGNKSTYDENSRIIVSTFSKCSVGFSCNKLNALILASDITSTDTSDTFIQVIGRVFRTKDVYPYIFDIVDDNKAFIRHFNIRKKTYLASGAKIENLKI